MWPYLLYIFYLVLNLTFNKEVLGREKGGNVENFNAENKHRKYKLQILSNIEIFSILKTGLF